MKIYVIFYKDEILGIVSTREKINEFIENVRPEYGNEIRNLYFREYELDKTDKNEEV